MDEEVKYGGKWSVRFSSHQDGEFVKHIVRLLGQIHDQSAGDIIVRALMDSTERHFGQPLCQLMVESHRSIKSV